MSIAELLCGTPETNTTSLLEEQLTATDEEDIAERILEPGVEAEEPHTLRDQDRLHWKARKVVQLDRAALPQERSPQVCAPPAGNRGPARTSSHTGRWVTCRTPVSVPTSPPHPRDCRGICKAQPLDT
ncbi:unnamed protein product [Rangifer tarandus platyrhynchus]|uniref:Uncharacterized protein n=1 Tax=Rangifer tarandus platyrhynchus TaxID=3082113 RepID=A0ABN8ZDX1_RANTA|nr:unnamed protein product [Rangifer tarandus platyrhynchus]